MSEALQTRTAVNIKDLPRSVSLVNPRATEPATARTASTADVQGEVALASVPETRTFLTNAVPQSAHDFVERVARISGVRCVIIEELEDGVMQCTTFLDEVSDSARTSVYQTELEVARKYPDQDFDFHSRFAREVAGGGTERIAGAHYFAVWGSLDADAR